MKIAVVLLFLSLLLLHPKILFAQIVINEISSSDEWVELYNTSSSDISLDGCVLNMGSSSQNVNFSASDNISALGYKVLEKGISSGWNSNWINNSGDNISFNCSILSSDNVSFGSEIGSNPYGRSPNGTGSFTILLSASKGSENAGPITPTPAPTPTATPTPSPTSTPKSTNTPTPTPSHTSTPVPTKTPTPTKTPKPTILGLASTPIPISSPAILSDAVENIEEIIPEAKNKSESPNIAVIIFIFIIGIVFISVPVWPFVSKRLKEYNDRNAQKNS